MMQSWGDVAKRMGIAEREPRSDDPDAGGVFTEHGWFSHGELLEVGASLGYDGNGERVVRFPTGYFEGRPQYRDIPDYVLEARSRRSAEG